MDRTSKSGQSEQDNILIKAALDSAEKKPANTKRSKRVEARFAPEVLETIRLASQLMGRSISDFIVTASLEAAQKTIETERVVRLSIEDQVRFVDSLANPPSTALERAKEAHKRLINKSTNE